MKSLIELTNISFKYKNKIILKNLNLKINKGEKIALLGKSGSGKTTLISILNGTRQVTNGEIKFYGKSFSKLENSQKRKIGTIWQDLRLIEDLSAEQNVNIGSLSNQNLIFTLKNLLNISKFIKAHKCMELCKINSSIFSKNLNNISGGQKQRIAIARSIIQEPEILFADEPFNNLDPKLCKYLKNLFISRLNNYKIKFPDTILFSFHKIDLIDGFTRVIGLRNGEIYFDMPRDELREFHLENIY
tara:strand:- start:719 stop:1453 length:735 start_codon:yes stop_codon:yes gene_type:complete